MQKILLYSGWALAVISGGGAFVFYRQADSLQTENKALSGEILALSQARKAEAALATKTIALPRESAPAPKDVVVALPDTFNLDKVVGDMIQDLSVDTEPVFSEKDRTRNKEEVAESDEQIARRNAMKQRYLESRFTGLFEALNLSPERVAELQGILQSHAEGVFDIRRMQREGLITEAEANVQLASIEGKLQSQLGSVLSPTELAQYQDYEATEPERRMTRTLSLQIKNHSNMAPALRNKLVASFHNQLLIETENPENGIPLDPFTRSNVAYANTLEQLSRELSPEEYAQAQTFMEERLRMQSAMLERISTWDVNRFNGGGPWGYEDLPGGGRRGSGGAGKPKL